MERKEARAHADLSSDEEGKPCVVLELGDWSPASGWRSDDWCNLTARAARDLANELHAAALKVEQRER